MYGKAPHDLRCYDASQLPREIGRCFAGHSSRQHMQERGAITISLHADDGPAASITLMAIHAQRILPTPRRAMMLHRRFLPIDKNADSQL